MKNITKKRIIRWAAAHLLGVAPSTISCYIRDGKLKKVTSGGVTGVWGKDVMRLM